MIVAQAWGVRHPGIGVLYYGSEEEARIAAGTAATMLPPRPLYRLVIPAPAGGWLTLFSPAGGEERLELAHQWQQAAKQSLRAAADLPFAVFRADATVEVRLPWIAKVGQVGVHVAEDCRPAWHQVRGVLHGDGIRVVGEVMTLGAPTGDAGGQGYLVLTLREITNG